MTNSRLLTPRLVLRRPEPADVDVIFAVHSDPASYAHNPSDALATRGEAVGLFNRWNEHWERFGFGYWVVSEGTSAIGFCGLKNMRLYDRKVLNLFYRFAASAWGHGYASEAATAVVGWATAAIADLAQRPVVARVRPDNVASARVAVKAGLVRAPELDGPGYDGFDEIFILPAQST